MQLMTAPVVAWLSMYVTIWGSCDLWGFSALLLTFAAF